MSVVLSPVDVLGTLPRVRRLSDLLGVSAPPHVVERTLEALRSLSVSRASKAQPTTPIARDSEPEVIDQADTAAAQATKSPSPAHTEGPAAGDPAINPEVVDALSLTMEELVRDHADAVYRVALSVTRDPMLAEDASQDALIKAWQALPSYRGDAPIRHWVLRITHNVSISLLRKRREEVMAPDLLPERVVPSRSVEALVHDRMAIDRFEEALDDLDGLSRSIVVLREIEGLSYRAISEMLELPLPTVRTRLLRARRQLAGALEGGQN